MPENTENQALIDVAQEAVDPYAVEATDGSGIYIVRDPDGGVRTIDLRDQLGLLPERPARKTGNVTLTEPIHLVAYLTKHGLTETEVYANDRDCTIKAVINAHMGTTGDGAEDYAGHGDHTATLTMRQSDDWKAWTTRDGQLYPQLEFSEFIEDHLPNFTAVDGGPNGADMLELAQTFQATTKVDFASSQRVKSGETQLVYSEQQSATAGKKGTLAIPDTFTLALQVFECGEAYKVAARFRYRIHDGQLRLGYRLTRPRDVLQDAFLGVIETVSGGIEQDIWSV